MYTIDVSFNVFNLIESLFWLVAAFIVIVYVVAGVPRRYWFLSSFTVLTLFLFGMSDMLEYIFADIRPALVVLLFLKLFCICGLCIATVWYIEVQKRMLQEYRQALMRLQMVSLGLETQDTK